MKRIALYLLLLISCVACNQKPTHQDDSTPTSSIKLTYATGFKIDQFNNYQRITLMNPWIQGEVLSIYYLVKSNEITVPTDGQKIKIPLQHLAISSCTQIGFLDLLNELPSITGVCNPELIYNTTLASYYQKGEVTNLGDAFNINQERLILLKPDAIMLSSYNQQDENAKRLKQSGIPVIYNNEWTEKSLLGRAEWIKLVAAFYDELPQGDSLFQIIENNYKATMRKVAQTGTTPSVMAGGNFKGTWYVPSGNTYMGRLFADAGTSYVYSNDSTNGSIPLNFETVLHQFSTADIWLNAPVATYKELYEMDSRHRLFKAAQENQVYGFLKRLTPSGANDFWESGVAHPDLVLKDIVWATHPDVLPDYEPTYIVKLQ